MRTVTYKSVLWYVARRMGIDPSTGSFTTELAAKYTDFINGRVPEVFGWCWWPELMQIEQRQYRDTWSASGVYAVGDEVWSATDESYYACTAAVGPSADAPEDDSSHWEAATNFERYVAYAQTGETVIWRVKYAARSNWRTNRYPMRLNFTTNEHGVCFAYNAPNQVWIEFQQPPPQFTSDEFDDTATYAVGDRVYYATTGEAYLCIAATTAGDLPTDTTKWTKIDMPEVFAQALARLAAADALREDGQDDKADAQEARGYSELARQRDAMIDGQGQFERADVSVKG